MQIVIPAAGIGSRLSSINPNQMPKSLIEICEKRIIDWQILALSPVSQQEYIFIVGSKHEDLKKYIIDKGMKNVKFIYNKDFRSTNCGYSLSLALPYVKSNWIYLNSDLLIDKLVIKSLLNYEGDHAVCVNYGDQSDLHKFTLDENKKIKDWMEIDFGQTTKEDLIGRPKADGEIVGPIIATPELANELIKIYESLDEIKKSKISCYKLFSLSSKYNYSTVDISSLNWKEVDTKEDYKEAEEILRNINE